MTLKELIKRHEGYSKFPYVDTVGKITIGWGYNLTDNGLPEAVAETLLDLRVEIAEQDLQTVFGHQATEFSNVRYNVLVDMMFNLGLTRFMKFKDMIEAIKKGDWEEASRQALDSVWAKQVGHRAIENALDLRNG